MKKFLMAILIMSFVAGESWLLYGVETNWQEQKAAELYDAIELDIEWAKNALADSEVYNKMLDEAQAKLAEIKKLNLIEGADKNAEITEKIDKMMAWQDLVEELTALKEFSNKATERVAEVFADANSANAEAMAQVSSVMTELEQGLPTVQNEKVMAISNNLQKSFADTRAAAEAVKNCIKVCYAAKMNELVANFQANIKNTSSAIEAANATIYDDVFGNV